MDQILLIRSGIVQDNTILGVPFKRAIVEPSGNHNVRTLELMPQVIGITIHNTANTKPSATDTAHAKWLQSVEDADSSYISSHFYVDEDSITQTCPITEVTFHAGDGKGDGNRKTISIEICENGDMGKAELNAQKLAAALLMSYPQLKVYKHQDWSGKNCPRVILARPNGWADFVAGIYILADNKPEEYNGVHIQDYYKATIMGESVASAEHLWGYVVAKGHADTVPPELPGLYLYEGYVEGVRGDIAFCQAMKETGFWTFGGIAKAEWNNPCGLGVTGPEGVGGRFDTLELGVRAHIQHLKAYGSDKELCQKRVDPRFTKITRGIAPLWVDLNGKWAVPGGAYGQDIMKMYVDMCLSKPVQVPEKVKEAPAISPEEYEEIIKSKTDDIKALTNIIENKNKDLKEIKEALNNTVDKLARLAKEHDKANTLIMSYKEKIKQVCLENDALLLSIDNARDELKEACTECAVLENTVENKNLIIQTFKSESVTALLKETSFIEWLKAKLL